MRKVWLVYDNTVGLPDELRIFTGEKAAWAYKLKMQKAGVKASDIVICDEPVERTGNVEVVRSIREDEPPKRKKAEIVITHKVPPKPKPDPSPSPIPPPPPEDPEEDEEDEEDPEFDNKVDFIEENINEISDPIEENRQEMNQKANNLPLAIKNRRVIDLVGH